MGTLLRQAVVVLFLGFGLRVSASVFYVDLNSLDPEPPYSDWATAATNIQDAVDLAVDGDTVVVTNGTYETGGRPAPGEVLTNRVFVPAAITLESVNGAAVTTICGYQVPGITTGIARCVAFT